MDSRKRRKSEKLSAEGLHFRLSRFSAAYRRRLLDGLKDVTVFCQDETGDRLARVLQRPKLADQMLARYVLHKHADTRFHNLALTKHALLGCQHVFPQLRGQLNHAWSNMKVWEEERTRTLRPPLPVAIWLAAVGLARAHSVVSTSEVFKQQWLILSVLLEIGFFCLLRPGEILRLRHCDVALPTGFVLCDPHAALKIVSPKNRRQFGESQFVLVKNRNTIHGLKSILKNGDTSPVWPFKGRLFGILVKQLMSELGVESCKFTPASLRPGGATMYYGAGVNISTLRFMGRWSVERSLEHYIQLAMSTQIMNGLPPKAIKRLKKLAPLCFSQVSFSFPCGSIVDPASLASHNSEEILEWCRKYTRLDEQCRA